MILVLADDLTGTCELAHIGQNYGLTTKVYLDLPKCLPKSIDLVCINSGTRSLEKRKAEEKFLSMLETAVRQGWNAHRIFLKMDSALRGYIKEFLLYARDRFEKENILFVPANPSKNRCIKQSNYLIDGTPIGLTDFSCDLQFPIRDSNVFKILGVPSGGDIKIPDINSRADIKYHLASTSERSLISGAADLFSCYLEFLGMHPCAPDSPPKLSEKFLWVCGSQSSIRRGNIQIAHQLNVHVLEMDESILELPSVLLTEVDTSSDNNGIEKKMAEKTRLAYSELKPKILLLEGGATAESICRMMGWTTFEPLSHEWQGIAGLRLIEPEGLLIFTKPGSYSWPVDFLRHLIINSSG